MRVLVYPHHLGIGGSQLNAIEIAAATRDLGHEVVVYGQPDVLNDRIEQLGLDFVESPSPGPRPSHRVVGHLRRVVRDRGLDVVHGYEWPPTLEGRLASLGSRAACVSTVMSMAVAPFIPRQLPLVVGTKQIAAVERQAGRRLVNVIEPGLDVVGFRRAHGIPESGRHVVCVTRLALELKLEGLLTAVSFVPTLGDDVSLTIVGGGPAQTEVAEAARLANAAAGRVAVVLTGEVADPRPAYESADVVLGMGGSALRALAFSKPLVVQGERGFWMTLTPQSLDQFLWTGWYGIGSDSASGPGALASELRPLLHSPTRRTELGVFGRSLVVERFSTAAAARTQVAVYEQAVAAGAGRRLAPGEDLRAGAALLAYKGGRLVAKSQRRASMDDFNARPAATGRAT